MAMNPEIKAQWISALRGGEYEQAQGMLHDPVNNEFCCLGVLCDLAVKAGVPVEVTDAAGEKTAYDDNEDTLPESVRLWAGLGSDNPRVVRFEGGEDEYEDTLAEINDRGTTFEEIADLIEDQL